MDNNHIKPPDLQNKHIMVVDDDEDDRNLFCKLLGHVAARLNCLPAANGQEALEYLGNTANPAPALIFLDINMPVMSGWQFLSKLRQREVLKDIPVIIFSTSSHPRDINIAYDLGATSYCVKPDDPAELERMLGFVAGNLDKNFKTFLNTGEGRTFFQTPS